MDTQSFLVKTEPPVKRDKISHFQFRLASCQNETNHSKTKTKQIQEELSQKIKMARKIHFLNHQHV